MPQNAERSNVHRRFKYNGIAWCNLNDSVPARKRIVP